MEVHRPRTSPAPTDDSSESVDYAIKMPLTTLSLDKEKSMAGENEQQYLPRWLTGDRLRNRLFDTFWVAVNTTSTIAIVFMNKNTLSDPQLRNSQILVAIWHFAVTFLVLLAASHKTWRLFTPIFLPMRQIFPLSAFFAGFLILNNLSLIHNPVGFYQLSKILTTPCVVLINFVLFRKMISKERLFAMLVTCVGMALVSVESVKSNLVGTLIASAAFTATACYQVWIGKKIVELNVDAPQLLLNQSAMAVWLLMPISFAFDTLPNFSMIPTRTLAYFVGGAAAASLINLSQFMIIGRTSALTFNIVSNVKMLVILSIGCYSEGKIFSSMDVLGVGLALTGAWLYAWKS